MESRDQSWQLNPLTEEVEKRDDFEKLKGGRVGQFGGKTIPNGNDFYSYEKKNN